MYLPTLGTAFLVAGGLFTVVIVPSVGYLLHDVPKAVVAVETKAAAAEPAASAV